MLLEFFLSLGPFFFCFVNFCGLFYAGRCPEILCDHSLLWSWMNLKFICSNSLEVFFLFLWGLAGAMGSWGLSTWVLDTACLPPPEAAPLLSALCPRSSPWFPPPHPVPGSASSRSAGCFLHCSTALTSAAGRPSPPRPAAGGLQLCSGSQNG